MKYPLKLKEDRLFVAAGDELEVLFFGNYMVLVGEDYFRSLATGHFVNAEVVYGKDGTLRNSSLILPEWLTVPFHQALFSSVKTEGSYSIISNRPIEQPVLLLNCLDGCYGHCLYKLANLLKLETEEGVDLVAIVPRSVLHLVPEFVAEVWVVDASFKALDGQLDGFQEFVVKQVQRLGEVAIVQAQMNLALEALDFTQLTRIRPFNFQEFGKSPYQISFILREDRFWLNGKLDNFLYLVCVKMGWLNAFKSYFVFRQNRLIKRFAQHLKKQVEVNLVAVGIGTTHPMHFLDDRRMDYPTFIQHEVEWLELYAKSHVCIGVHGSNMLLPSFLGGACISLVPDFKIANFSEDMIPRPNEPVQRALFFARNLPVKTSARQLNDHVVTMLKGWTHGEKLV